MKKVASPKDLVAELTALSSEIGSATRPSREKLAAALRGLADRVGATNLPKSYKSYLYELHADLRRSGEAYKAGKDKTLDAKGQSKLAKAALDLSEDVIKLRDGLAAFEEMEEEMLDSSPERVDCPDCDQWALAGSICSVTKRKHEAD